MIFVVFEFEVEKARDFHGEGGEKHKEDEFVWRLENNCFIIIIRYIVKFDSRNK